MELLLRFLKTFKTLFFFIALEIVALVLVANHSHFQRIRLLNSSNSLVGNIYDKFASFSDYFSLGEVNEALAEENVSLKRELAQLRSEISFYQYDSTLVDRSNEASNKHYTFRTAKVIQASTSLSNNHLTIDKGTTDGLRKGMGVINEKGVVGIVSDVSPHFSVVLPIINSHSRINVNLAGKCEVGTLLWNGGDVHVAKMEEVPHYIDVQSNDTVRTSIYSSVFPEGILVGTVDSWKSRKDNFYSIKVNLSVDFEKLSYVDVIELRYAEEQNTLMESEVTK